MRIEPSHTAQDEYDAAVFAGSTGARKFYAACTPGHYSNEGVVDTETKSLAATFPNGQPGGGGIPAFLNLLRQQQQADAVLTGYDIV